MSERLAKKVLVVGWDAADWKTITPLMDAGLMPSLESLVNRGVMGNIATLDPPLSPLLWTSIATGKTADQHGVLGFVQPDERGEALRPVLGTSRKAKAVWNIFNQSASGRTSSAGGRVIPPSLSTASPSPTSTTAWEGILRLRRRCLRGPFTLQIRAHAEIATDPPTGAHGESPTSVRAAGGRGPGERQVARPRREDARGGRHGPTGGDVGNGEHGVGLHGGLLRRH